MAEPIYVYCLFVVETRRNHGLFFNYVPEARTAGGRRRVGGRTVGRGRRWGGAGGLPERGAGCGRGSGEAEGEAKGEGKEKEEESRPRGRLSHFLCRVSAIRHSAKIFLKFKNKLCRVPDHGHSAKAALPSARCTALGKVLFFILCQVSKGSHSAKYTLFFYIWQPKFLWCVPTLFRPTSTILVQL
jgi:hypothetical protein